MNSKKFNVAISIVNLLILASGMCVIFLQPQVVYADSTRLLNSYKDMQSVRAAYQKKVATSIFRFEVKVLERALKIKF